MRIHPVARLIAVAGLLPSLGACSDASPRLTRVATVAATAVSSPAPGAVHLVDYERHPEVSEAVIRWAAINGMLRRITRGQPARRQLRRTFTWT